MYKNKNILVKIKYKSIIKFSKLNFNLYLNTRIFYFLQIIKLLKLIRYY
jgi:hypothetical protein